MSSPASTCRVDWLQLVEHARRLHSEQVCIYISLDELPALNIPDELRTRGACCVVCGRLAATGDRVALFVGGARS